MYDKETSSLLHSVPELPELTPTVLPETLTRHYAEIVAARLGGEELVSEKVGWNLARIADTYELIVSATDDRSTRRSSAFVAASAQALLGHRERLLNRGMPEQTSGITRDQVSPELAAILLYLSSEQFADAHEAALNIHRSNSSHHTIESVVANYITNLGKGKLGEIVSFAEERATLENEMDTDLEDETVVKTLLHTLASGIEVLADGALNGLEPGEDLAYSKYLFEKVKSLSIASHVTLEAKDFGSVQYCAPGVHHLSSLLIAAYEGVSQSLLINLAVPEGCRSVVLEKSGS